jgi:hypothetical protein
LLIDNRRMQTATFRQIASSVATAALVVFIAPLQAQTRLTADDYSRAEQFLGYNTNRLVLHLAAQATWVGDDRFWYRATTENGTEFFQVEAATGAAWRSEILLAISRFWNIRCRRVQPLRHGRTDTATTGDR